jgi:hypothetical protein
MTTKNYFQSRVSQGKMNEGFFKSIIEKDIKASLKTNSEFDLFDFENENYKIELKTREVERFKYPTTIVGYDKIVKGLEYLEQNKNIVFYFGFKKDGLFKFNLTKDNYKDFKISNIGCRFRENKKPHLEIPVNILEFVCDDCPLQDEYSKRTFNS